MTRRCAIELSPEMTPVEHELLLGILEKEEYPGKHLEVGTAAGGTLCRMLETLPPENRHFVVVDTMTYFDDQLEAVKTNLQNNGLDAEAVEFRVKSSDAAFREAMAVGEKFDFMLIDAGHKIMDVMRDLRWTRLLCPGGIVCLHDYDSSWAHRGVVVAVDRFLAGNSHYERIAHSERLLVLRKLRSSPSLEVTGIDIFYARLAWLPLRIIRTFAKLRKRGQRLMGKTANRLNDSA